MTRSRWAGESRTLPRTEEDEARWPPRSSNAFRLIPPDHALSRFAFSRVAFRVVCSRSVSARTGALPQVGLQNVCRVHVRVAGSEGDTPPLLTLAQCRDRVEYRSPQVAPVFSGRVSRGWPLLTQPAGIPRYGAQGKGAYLGRTDCVTIFYEVH